MKNFIRNLLEESGYSEGRLLQILRKVQDRYLHIPPEAVDQIAEALRVSRARIVGVAEFYSFLHLEPAGRYEILVSDSITDRMLGNQRVIEYFLARFDVEEGRVRTDGLVRVGRASCTGMCEQGPACLVNGFAITRLDKGKMGRIAGLVESRIPVSEWPEDLFRIDDNIRKPGLLLQNPPKPGDGIRSLLQRGAEEILKEVEVSGLRGRGGAGFSTGMKWRFCREAENGERYVVCNADEGEPGTFKDRVLLNSYADSVFEGMTLCAAVVGAQKGFLYLRGEYLYLYDKLQETLARRRRQGLLGGNILETELDFDIEIHLGAGAYICGEESALIESLEGRPGVPRNRPPYPVTHGYRGKPTVVNNVETFAAASAVAANGGRWFASHGTDKSKGSKILSISGDCARPGIYEYDFGVAIEEILADCGSENAMGVQIGGPSGVFISDREFSRRLAFEDLATGGSFMIFNRRRSLSEIVRNFTDFFAHESCGFCTPCRVGTSLLKKQFDKICLGHGSAGDLVELEKLGRLVKTASHCGLGQTAANPILTTLARFPEYYENMLKEISYEPGFDLDGSLETARRMTGRDDAYAHLSQLGEEP
ncbi:MAG: NAD(P)H-dependent oxidoreductase subunit E [Gammaproteobacteria bacterium]